MKGSRTARPRGPGSRTQRVAVHVRDAAAAPLAFALLSLSLCTAPAQAQFFNGVFSRDAIDVIAVADSGALYRSVNGGVAWTRTQLGNKPLRDVVAWDWNIVALGDSGKVWRSADLGGTWAVGVVTGAPNLRRIERLAGGTLIAVGSGGTVVQSGNGGATWSAQASGTSERLNSVRFVDGQHGWIAGANGFLARTSNAGASWTPVGLGTANDLNCVDAKGSAVWVAGDNATAFRSSDTGNNWSQLNLHADARPDVKAVWVQSADTVYITGGGGFIRRSVDGGNTWSFQQHTLQGQTSDLYFVGPNGWVTSSRVRAVMRTNNGGATWSMPAAAVTSRAWMRYLTMPGSVMVRGSTITTNPFDKNTFYAALWNVVYRSRDEGENWEAIASIPPPPPPPNWNTDRVNSFIVSEKDSNYWVAAVEMPDRVIWTDDAGVNWHDAIVRNFGEYGIPLEVDPDRPDTMYFGSESMSPDSENSPIFRSIDRGKTWTAWSDTLFRSPCDIVVVPESDSAVIIVGDGVTGDTTPPGRYWRGTAGSPTFTQQLQVIASEIPGLACSRLRNSVAFGTNWSSGGMQRSTNFGLTWSGAHTATQAWGVDIARDDPDCVVFGVYGGANGYISFTGGVTTTSFTAIGGLFGSNYSFYVRDRATILAQQSDGIWKLKVSQTMPVTAQSVAVTAPNGGEVWAPGSVHDITWNATNVALARIQYRRASGEAWQTVAEVEGYRGRYTWTVPYDATASARVLVTDGWDAAPQDSSDAGFTIPLALIAESPASLGFGTHAIGTEALQVVTVTNPGTAPLVVSSITTGTSVFRAGRGSLTLGAGASDTLGVTFAPGATTAYVDQLTLSSNGYNAPEWQVPLYGSGMDTVALDLASPDGGESWRYGTQQKIQWTSALVSAVDIAYQAGSLDPWVAIADSVPDAGKSYVWVIPAAQSNDCRVRLRQHGGGMEDASKEVFSITAPSFRWAGTHQFRGELEFGPALLNEVKSIGRRVMNAGTAPLEISAITSDNPKFWPGRMSLVLAPGADDTLGFYYLPEALSFDTARVTLVSNDPYSPLVVRATGRGATTVAVEDGGPTAFALWQNRPNPFTGRTMIRYALPVAARVSLEVFNVKGERVATLVDEEKAPGIYSVGFGPGPRAGGARLPAGIYFYRYRAGSYAATHRMVLMN